MNTKHFFVVKKSSGMNIKRFIVCINAGGYFQEI